MAVVIETTLGDVTVDLFVEQRPRTCLNFLKLCKLKYYNFNLFHTIQHGFIAQTGDPSGEGTGGCSIWGVIDGPSKTYFEGEKMPKLKHSEPGLLSMVASESGMVGSQFFFTLNPDLNSLDSRHCIIGQVTEGHDILRQMNETICDSDNKPYQDVRITHTVILEDPFDDPVGFRSPSRSPSPSAERLAGGRIAPDEEIDEFKGKTEEEVAEMIQEREAKARATILEIVGDLPDAEMAPPENVLFVCKLNPVTTDDDLEIIFSRFGKINCCEVIRDKKSGDSLQYAFIEFENKKSCEDAYFKMDNVLIDDRRIHVDFSQSVSKIKWRGKGRGVIHIDDSQSESDNKHIDKKNNDYTNFHNKRDVYPNNRNKNDRTKIDEQSLRRRNESTKDSKRSRERYRDPRDNRNYKNDESRRYNKDRMQENSRYRDQSDGRSKYADYRDNRGNEKNKERDRSFNQSPDRSRNREPIRNRSPERSRNRERFEKLSPERKNYKSDYRSPDRFRNTSERVTNKLSDRFNDRSRDNEKSYERKKYSNTPDKSRDSHSKHDKSLNSSRDNNGKNSSYESEHKYGKKYKDDNLKRYNNEDDNILTKNSDSLKCKNILVEKSSKITQEIQNGSRNLATKERHNKSKDNHGKSTRENYEREIDSNSSKNNVKGKKRRQSSESISNESSSDDSIPTKRIKKNENDVKHTSKKKYDVKNQSKKKHNDSETENNVEEDKGKINKKNKKYQSNPKSKSAMKKKKYSSSSSSSSSETSSESSDDSSANSKTANKKKTPRKKVAKKNVKVAKKSKKVELSSTSESSSSNSDSSSSSTNSSDSGHEQSRKKSKNKKSVREKLIKKKSKK